MVNPVHSIGYGIGKLHTGLIVYLCDLFNDGVRQPAEAFFSTLGVPLNGVNRLEACPEYSGIDLMIWGKPSTDEKRRPVAMIEMKVDDYEHRVRGRQGFQTEVYAKFVPDCKSRLFVTLGGSEFYAPPTNMAEGSEQKTNAFRWIRLAEFSKAVEAITGSDQMLLAWREALGDELDLRQRAACATEPPSAHRARRGGNWNICVLGAIKERLSQMPGVAKLNLNMRAYLYGTRPDTILNFGRLKKDKESGLLYAEINYGGSLNLKITLDQGASQGENLATVDRWIKHYAKRLEDAGIQPREKRGGRVGKTKTLLSVDVGLKGKSGDLYFEEGLEATCEKVMQSLYVFYSQQPEFH